MARTHHRRSGGEHQSPPSSPWLYWIISAVIVIATSCLLYVLFSAQKSAHDGYQSGQPLVPATRLLAERGAGDQSWRDSETAAAAAVATAEEKASRCHFCSQPMYMKNAFNQIGLQVQNQDRALAQMAEALNRNRKFRSVALMGPPGVGKTMTATALIKSFPWPENVRTYSWNSKGSGKDDVSKFRKLREFMHGLSGCGMNLHIIDDLTVDNPDMVPIYNEMLLRRESEGTKDKGTASETVIVVYIFNLKPKDLENQLKYLQKLSPDTTSVVFRCFEPKDLKSCLENELKAANYKLSEEAEIKVLEGAQQNLAVSGCKSLKALVQQLGEPVTSN
ncbi:uncharacterized protein LOC117896914 isoform X1 [Drosophila subobscura]|uniref:uncharacterized protein LOC117896914 isoform X1 n=2 Tax=Drosophila subobscura TaxID=7241 RepID=UPI00155B32C6|nr:uncharacterized protein LOC117896914 isoform X1 [Drosophila subobscura]